MFYGAVWYCICYLWRETMWCATLKHKSIVAFLCKGVAFLCESVWLLLMFLL